MPADNLPRDVIRILSLHGPVSWWVGGDAALARGSAPVAPFEDVVFLFLPTGSPGEQALLTSTRMVLQARHPSGDYNLRMMGRAHAGLPLARHPRRAEIGPWAPEGHNPQRLLVVPFIAESVELVRQDGEISQRHEGRTPAGDARPSAGSVWVRTALGGLAAPFALLVLVGVWLRLALAGPELPFRPLAMLFCALGGLLPLAAARLLVLSRTFLGVREGRVRAGESEAFEDALLAPGQVTGVALRLGALGLASLLLVAGVWGAGFAALTFGLSGVWVLAPVWAVHLSAVDPRR